jgi:hypothetical protein
MATLKEVLNGQPDLLTLAKAGNYAGVVAALEVRTQVNNPVTVAPQVPKGITLKRVMQIVPATEMAAAYKLAGFVSDVKTAIDANDREYMATLIGIAVAASAVTAPTAGALQAELQATVPDPSWTVKIPSTARWQKLGLSALPSASDVQAVVNGGA